MCVFRFHGRTTTPVISVCFRWCFKLSAGPLVSWRPPTGSHSSRISISLCVLTGADQGILLNNSSGKTTLRAAVSDTRTNTHTPAVGNDARMLQTESCQHHILAVVQSGAPDVDTDAPQHRHHKQQLLHVKQGGIFTGSTLAHFTDYTFSVIYPLMLLSLLSN